MTLFPFQNVAGFVLAGGASQRMGQDKALLELGGVPMVLRAARLVQPFVVSVAVVAPLGRYAEFDLNILPDRWPGAGPLGGIATALGATSVEWNLILGCDLPYLSAAWMAWFVSRARESAAQAVVPESSRGLEPLAAMYHRSCGASLVSTVQKGVRRVTEGLSQIQFERIRAAEWREIDPEGLLFENMNTLGDYAEARRRIDD